MHDRVIAIANRECFVFGLVDGSSDLAVEFRMDTAFINNGRLRLCSEL
jgi:hypothetical protein